MERIRDQKASGLNSNGLRTWATVFLALGIVGRSILQNRILCLGQMSPMELLEAMQGSRTVMILATAALVLQALETCAVPIFAFLLVEGASHTANLPQYILRVAFTALVSEIPYNLAMSGTFLDFTSRNPVFGSVIGLLMLWFYRYWEGKTLPRVLIRVAVTLAAMLWCIMLSVSFGPALLLILAVLWALREKPMLRSMAGAMAALVCSVGSLFYMASPMGFLAVHFYNGEKGTDNRTVSYLAYPVLLLAVWAVGVLMF